MPEFKTANAWVNTTYQGFVRFTEHLEFVSLRSLRRRQKVQHRER